ncbi:MAG: glycosyltransferase family 2 protein [Anaerolineaceae bacterium]
MDQKLLTDISPLLRLSSVTPTNHGLTLLTEDISKRYSVVPIGQEKNTFVLAGPNPLDIEASKDLEIILGFQIRVMRCTWSDFKWYQACCYTPLSPGSKVSFEENRKRFRLETSNEELTENRNQPRLSGPITQRRKNSEIQGLELSVPHFSSGHLVQAKGLELLLPESLPRQHFVPLGWVDGVLFCLIDNITWIEVFNQYKDKLEYQCQLIIADPNVFQSAYQQYYLHTSMPVPCNEEKVVASLLQRGYLTLEQATYVLEIKRQTNLFARNVLLNSNLVTADIWLTAYAKLINSKALLSANIPNEFEKSLVQCMALIPAWIVRKFQILPIFTDRGGLVIGLKEMDYRLISLAKTITHLEIEPRLMDSDVINKWIEKVYPTEENFEKYKPIYLEHLLVGFGYLTSSQIREVMTLDAENHQHWLAIAYEKRYLSENELIDALGYFTGYPTLSMDHFPIDETLIKKYSTPSMKDFDMIPLCENRDIVCLAVTNPLDSKGFQRFETEFGKSVRPVIIPQSIMAQVIQQYGQQNMTGTHNTERIQLLDKLVTEEILTRQQALAALGENETGVATDKVIFHQTGADPEMLAKTFARLVGVNYEDISLTEMHYPVLDALGVYRMQLTVVDPIQYSIARLISLEIAKSMDAIPIRFDNEKVVVAFADPLFESVKNKLELILGRTIIPVLTTRTMLEEGIIRSLHRPKLGEGLLLAGMISQNQLNDALDYSRKTNVHLAIALVYKDYITEDNLYKFLAKRTNLPLVDISETPVDENAARLLESSFERTNNILPIAVENDHVILALMDPDNQEGFNQAEAQLGVPCRKVLIKFSDFNFVMEKIYRQDYLDESITQLMERSTEDSAYHVLETNQIISLIIFVLLSLVLLIYFPDKYLIFINALITVFYLGFSIYKFKLIFKAISGNLEVPVSDQEVADLKDSELPVYTILVPVHREAEMLPDILKSLEMIDYPQVRLDILVLMEEDDLITLQKFDEIDPPHFIQKIIVPSKEPKTKPKACNFGLIHARGEYVVIFDAEDLPDTDQLKKVVIAFSKVPSDVACIQAKLNYYNRKQNVLTEWFTIEYSMWFDLLLPGLDSEHAPIPLGGTSNHFRRSSLLKAGAWDPHNVTEDADLGIRLFKQGYRTRIVDSTTYEEANSQFGNWIRQRSRWMKGYIQTWLVHMRHPFRMIREIGFKNFVSFQFIVGGTPFSAILNPIYWIMTILWFVAEPEFINRLFPTIVFFMGAICLFVGVFVFTYINIAGTMRRGYFDMVKIAIFSPLYWALSSIASWKGLIQLVFRPHFWEKTTHGLYQKPVDASNTEEV